jgi:ATP-dependent Clp protease ATP-binding subunit ClpA
MASATFELGFLCPENLNSVVTGAKYRDEFEERAMALIDEVTARTPSDLFG